MPTYIRTILPLVLTLFISAGAHSQKKNWTPEDIIHTEYVRAPVFSEDGNLVVWTKSEGNKEKDKFIQNLYLTRLNIQKEGKPLTVALTKNEENDYNPVFSADGETIYFLSGRDEGKKLWSISVHGGEAQEVHEFKNGISSLSRLNKDHLVFISNDGKTLYEEENKKDNTVVVEDEEHWKINRVYSFGLKDKSIKRLTENEYPVSSYEVSRDGKYMVTSHLMSLSYAADATVKPTHYLHDLSNGTKKEILKGLQTPGAFAFDPPTKGFYFTSEYSSDPEWNGAGFSQLHYYDLAEEKETKIDLDWENGLAGRSYAIARNGVIASLANGPVNTLAFYEKNGASWKKTSIELGDMKDHVDVLAVSPDQNKLLFVYLNTM